MRIKLVLAWVVLLAGWAVNKTAAATKPAADMVARVHFVGMTQVADSPYATSFNAIWQIPATQELLEQTIAKLATAPHRIYATHFTDTNDYADRLRPLFHDLIDNEFYVEVRGPTNAVPELLLAVRLDKKRAEAWRTGIASVLTAWTTIPVKDITAEGFSGWELRKHHDPDCIRFFQAGEWVVFGWGWNDLLLQPSMLKRIKENKRPVAMAKDYTLDAWVDWPALTASHPIHAPFIHSQLPKMQLTVTNAPGFIRSKLVMQFPEPLNLTLEPWQIPTNTIRNKITSFTAARGIAPWLSQFSLVKSLSSGTVPQQWFLWAQDTPFETRLAVPVKNSAEFLQQLAPKLIPLVNSNLQKVHLSPGCQVDTNGDINISNFPFCAPSLRGIRESGNDYILGGLILSPERKDPVPPTLFEQVTSRSNLVYYDWEITADRIGQWRVLSQLAMIVERKVITDTNSIAQKWIDGSKKQLGNCATLVTLSAPNELTLIRNSTVGFTGFELTGLAIWLDSPEFPLPPYLRPTFPDDPDQPPPPTTPK